MPQVGQWMEVKHTFPQEAVDAFAKYSGDNNPIHLSEEYAKGGGKRHFKGCVVHGLLVSGLFSMLFGRSFAGALYVTQELKFKKPVHVGDKLTARIEVLRSRAISRGDEVLLSCSTVVTNESQGNTAIEGEAKVLLPR
ncbi:dehydratase [Tribonema minus]|uniref:Dehydratase n=1 Tax=Tribonema minus TaxID=303371 RepID=A0A836C9Q9_9STRA|nr:dehydratase [Tribonema minus]